MATTPAPPARRSGAEPRAAAPAAAPSVPTPVPGGPADLQRRLGNRGVSAALRRRPGGARGLTEAAGEVATAPGDAVSTPRSTPADRRQALAALEGVSGEVDPATRRAARGAIDDPTPAQPGAAVADSSAPNAMVAEADRAAAEPDAEPEPEAEAEVTLSATDTGGDVDGEAAGTGPDGGGASGDGRGSGSGQETGETPAEGGGEDWQEQAYTTDSEEVAGAGSAVGRTTVTPPDPGLADPGVESPPTPPAPDTPLLMAPSPLPPLMLGFDGTRPSPGGESRREGAATDGAAPLAATGPTAGDGRPAGGRSGAGRASPAPTSVGDASLDAWKAAASGAISETKAGELTEGKEGPGRLQAEGQRIDAARKEEKPDYGTDAKSTQPPLPEEPDKEEMLDTGPADNALARLKAAGEQRLADQTFSPVGLPPPYPGLNPRDFVPATQAKAISDLEAKLAGVDLRPGERASLTEQLERARAEVAAIEQATVEGSPAEVPPVVVDKGAASLEPLAPAQADVLGDAVARMMGMVDVGAKSIVDRAVAAMNGTGVAPLLTMAAAEEGAVRSELQRELQDIAEVAGVTADQLTAKVAEQKVLVRKEQEAVEAGLQASAVAATEQVEQRAGQEAMEIADARATVDAENEAKQQAVDGPPDTEAIERKRDEYLGKVAAVAAQAHAAARAARERRDEELGRAAGEQKSTVKRAADAQAAAIRRHWANDPDLNKGMAESRPTQMWGTTRSAAVDSEMRRLQESAKGQSETIDRAVDTEADRAKEQVRDWAAGQEGRERSWWERLVDRIRDWFQQASADNAAWERQRNAESRDRMAADFGALTALKEAQGRRDQQAMAAELDKMDVEQRKLAVAYFRGGISSIQFVAESTMNRIADRRIPELATKMEQEAIASWGWEDLGILAQASNRSFRPSVLANQVRSGVAGWGTNESQVYAALGGVQTAVERAALAKCYLETFKVSIEEDVRGDMEDHELERAEALMAGKVAVADAAAIKEAVDGAGTDEDAINQALRGKTPEEIEAIKAEYRRMYRVELTTDLTGDLSGPELDISVALASGDVDAADAAELEEAMDGPGTDEEKLRKVYERIREEEEATARRENLRPAELRSRIAQRNARVRAKYDARYGDLETNMTAELADVDESAVGRLRSQGSPLLDNADVKLMHALQSGDATQIDAMRALREHEGAYTSDDEIEKIVRNQHKQADLDVSLELAAEQARIKALWESGDLTPDEFKAHQAAWKARSAKRDETIKTRAQAKIGELKLAYAGATGGSQTFDELVAEETSGTSRLEIRDLVAAGGALSPEDEIYYSIAGTGTDEDKLKETLRGKTPAEIERIRKAYEKKHGEGSFDSDILEDLSGREDLDVGHILQFGDPETFGRQLAEAKTPAERTRLLGNMRTVLAERKAFEETGSIGQAFALGADPMNSTAQLEQALKRAEEYDAALTAAELRNPGRDPAEIVADPALQAARAKFEMNYAGAIEAQEQVRKQIDAYTDVAAQVGAAVVGIAVTVLTAGAATPAALAAAAAWGAAASATASMAIKVQLKGAAYSWEEAGVDVAVGVVDVGVSALTAYAVKVVRDALENAIRMRVARQLAKEGVEELGEAAVKALVKEAMAEAIENGVQAMPSAALAAMLSDDTWKSGDPWGSIMGATYTAGVMGAGMGVGMHAAGEAAGAVSKSLKRTRLDTGATPAVHAEVPPTTVTTPAKGVDPDQVEIDLPPAADPVQVAKKAAETEPPPGAAPEGPARSPRGSGGDEGAIHPRKPHVDEDGMVDLDDPRNRWMIEDSLAGQLPDALAADPVASRQFFEGFVREQPELESALIRNSETGEHIIVQGSPSSVDIRSGHGVWEGLIPPDKVGTGRWELVVHNHPVDPLSRLTPDWARVPSGADGDFGVAVHEANASGRAVMQEIRITTEQGPEVTRYGYDPGHREPYSIDMPAPDGGREVRRFGSIEDYEEWYRGRFDPARATPGATTGTGSKAPVSGIDDDIARRMPKGGTAPAPPVPRVPTRHVATEAEAAAQAEITRLRKRLYGWRGAAGGDARAQQLIADYLDQLSELARANRAGEAVEGQLAGIRESLPVERRLLSVIKPDRVEALARRARRLAQGVKHPADDELNRIADELNRIADAAEALAARAAAHPGTDVRNAFDILQQQLRRATRQDFELVEDLTDPARRAAVLEWFDRHLTPLEADPVGELLANAFRAHLEIDDMLVLQQSPRSAGTPVAQTEAMRRQVRDAVAANRWPEYTALFEAAARDDPRSDLRERSRRAWPHTPDGRAWQVDHVVELWLGGADDMTNYVAVPPAVHELKTQILADYRREFRRRAEHDEQLDMRATDPLEPESEE